MALKFKEFFKGIILKALTSNPTDDKEGSVWLNSTDANQLKSYLGGSVRNIVTDDQAQTLTNKDIDADNNTLSNLEHGAEVDDPSTGVHGVTGTIVGDSDTQTLSNKTLDNTNIITVEDASFTLQDDGDNTKQVRLELNPVSTGTTRILTVPDANTTIVGHDATQVITNKDIDGGVATDSRRITIPKETRANLEALTRKEGTLVYATDDETLLIDTGTELEEIGSGTGLVKVDFIDPLATSLPTGPTVTFDGVSGQNGDLILFSNLASNNNRVYELSGVGSSIAFTAMDVFAGEIDPSDGDMVVIRQGDAFAEQISIFDGTNWKVNDTIRLFDGVSANFWELSSIKVADIVDNTTTNIFTVAELGSENFIVSYSILRNGNKQTGELFITSDGTDVAVSNTNAFLGDTGIEFQAQLNAGDIELDAIASSTGFNATMKYFVKRWSDATTGGPTGIPSYSSAGDAIPAAGNTGEIQFRGTDGNLDADADLKWDSTEESINLNGLYYSKLSAGITINDNQVSPTTLFTYSATTYHNAIIEYSVVRDGEYRTGRFLVSNDSSSNTGFNDDFVETNPTGVSFDSNISGGNVEIRYTSTNTGFSGTFKYSIRKW